MKAKSNYFVTYMFILMNSLNYGQVGIGTTNPQQELHIKGSSTTIRIESLDVTNSPLLNDGIKLAPAFVDGDGNISLYGSGGLGIEPLNFLIQVPNFIIDNPYGHPAPYDETGIVINSTEIQSENVGEIGAVELTVPREALIEVKYGVTIYIRGSNMQLSPPWAETTPGEAVQIGIYFCVDLNNNGLSAEELNKKYGIKGLYYESNYGGIPGHPYMNGQGYMELPQGTHKIYFFGGVKDNLSSYTSIGFGGAEDYLKIRVFE
jgi:hypothetical protein